VWNLLANAVKFTGRGGRVDVQIRRAGPAADIIISDNGQGISSEFLPFAFDRFRQADSSPSRRHGGLGLGLALVRQIVELHGGTASVHSDGSDRGSTFTVHLPVSEGSRPAPRLTDTPDTVTLKGVAVLVVDDNDDSRELLRTAIREYGARVHAVQSTDEALRVMEEGRFKPDVLVSDIGLPGIDGFELIRRIRAQGTTRALPAIAVTAYADPEDRIRALIAGYQTHLPKPVDLAVLAAAIAGLVPAKPRPCPQPA
jgi:CheY-like chemotaxis protein